MPSLITGKSSDTVAGNCHLNLREELIDEIFDYLYRLSNATEEQSREIEKLTGLSKNQALTIKAVSRSPSVRVSELARSLFLNPATMVRILDRLEEQGLVIRTRSSEDRRVVEIALTDKAKDIEQILLDITHDRMIDCLASFEDRELLNMLITLHKLSLLLVDAPLSASGIKTKWFVTVSHA